MGSQLGWISHVGKAAVFVAHCSAFKLLQPKLYSGFSKWFEWRKLSKPLSFTGAFSSSFSGPFTNTGTQWLMQVWAG